MKIKKLFLINFLLISFLVASAAFLAFLYFHHVHNEIQKVLHSNIQEVRASSRISFLLNEFNKIGYIFLITPLNQDILNKKKLQFEQQVRLLEKAIFSWKNAILFEWKTADNDQKKNRELQELKNWNSTEKNLLLLTSLLREIMAISPSESAEKINAIKNRFLELSEKLDSALRAQHHEAEYEFNNEVEIILKTLIRNGWLSLGFILVILLLNISLSLIMTRFIIRRLSKFKDATDQIAKGHYNVKVTLYTQDEFGILATAFNHMAMNIARYQTYLDNIINTMPNMLFITSSEYDIQDVNQRVLDTLGYTKEELLKKNFNQVFWNKNELKSLMNFSFSNQKTCLKTKENHDIPVLFSTALMKLDEKEFKLIHIAQDITLVEKMEHELILVARQAGMAEIATYVLHNVGNILNSVTTSVLVIDEKIDASPLQNLKKLSEILEENKENLSDFLTSDKGKILPRYLTILAKSWEEEKNYLKKEIRLLQKNITHIITIIRTQQSLKSPTDIMEWTVVSELMEEALQLNKTKYTSTIIEIERDYKLGNKVFINRVKLIQVIVNLISNSVASLLESSGKEKKLLLRVAPQDENYFMIEVCDNGVGILPENKVKIFSYGFTTKVHGHGFGLHGSALSVKEMDGFIEVHSDGLNQGACFKVILPYKQKLPPSNPELL